MRTLKTSPFSERITHVKKVMNIAVLLNINFKVVNLIFKNYHCFTLATDLIEKNVTALPYT